MNRESPVRSCVVCRTRCPQRALLRVARMPDGTVQLDSGARRAAGRGAYLCAAARCVSKAQGALQRALRVPLSDELLCEIAQRAEELRRDGAPL